MAKTTKTDKPNTEDTVSTTALAEAPETSVTTHTAGSMHIDTEDIDIPRINVIQKMSQIDAPIGSIVLNKTHVLAEAEVPLEAVVVAAQKGWREDIPFDEDQVPRIAWSKEQADLIAAESDWPMIEFAEITLLIKQPEGNDDEAAFPFPIGDSNYALGRINVSKNAYRSTYKRLATFTAFNRNIPLFGRVWTFASEVLTKGKYSWYSPSLTITKDEAGPEVISFLKNFGI